MIRELAPGDEDQLEEFLTHHSETSMFLRSNLKKSGLKYQDHPYHGSYFASFTADNHINGVLAHFWNGNLMMQVETTDILKGLLKTLQSFSNLVLFVGLLGLILKQSGF